MALWRRNLDQTGKRLHSHHRTSHDLDICPAWDKVRYSINARAISIALAFFLFACLLPLVFTLSHAQAGAMRVEEVVLISKKTGRHRVMAEIADTPQLKARGLMFRKNLPAERGMLFLSKSPHEITMWMRNTYISLDMIFIAQDGRIHHIAEHTEPFSEAQITSHGKALGVLEMIAGSAARLGLKRGDKVEHPHFAKK